MINIIQPIDNQEIRDLGIKVSGQSASTDRKLDELENQIVQEEHEMLLKTYTDNSAAKDGVFSNTMTPAKGTPERMVSGVNIETPLGS